MKKDEFYFKPHPTEVVESNVTKFIRDTGCVRLKNLRDIRSGDEQNDSAIYLPNMIRTMRRIKIPQGPNIFCSVEVDERKSVDPRRRSIVTSGSFAHKNGLSGIIFLELLDLRRRVTPITPDTSWAGQVVLHLGREPIPHTLERIGIEFSRDMQPYTTKISLHYPGDGKETRTYHSRHFDDIHIYLQSGTIAPILGRQFQVNHHAQSNGLKINFIDDTNVFMKNFRKRDGNVQSYDWSRPADGWQRTHRDVRGVFAAANVPYEHSPFSGLVEFLDTQEHLAVRSKRLISYIQWDCKKTPLPSEGVIWNGTNVGQVFGNILRHVPPILANWNIRPGEIRYGDT